MDPAEKSCDDDPGPSQAATQPSHRRTRSGCYTCRKRRVKCDELRPHCKRCQKGNRECVFPPERLTMSKKQRAIQERKLRRAAAAAAAAAANANANSTGLNGSAAAFAPTPGFGGNALLEVTTTNPDPLTLPSSATTIPASNLHQNTSTTVSSISPSLSSNFVSSSSSTDAPASFSSSSTSPASATKLSITPSAIPLSLVTPQPNPSQACTVSPEIARLFKYHAEHITPYHYFLSLDPFDFFPYIIDAAPTCEPLMYALASFTSYHYALRHGERYLVDMFEYYEKCVHSLHDALAQPNILVMTAILTLSCIEMYLGDVSNEVQHQDVVFHLVETNYTPENFFVDQYHMYIFVWLRTIDVRRAMLSGHYLVFNTKWNNTHRTLLAQLSAICGTNEEVSMQLLIFKYIVDMGAIFSEVCKFGADVREEKLAGHSAVRRIEVLRVRSMTWIESFDRALFETDEIPENHGLSQEDHELIPPIIYKRREIGFIMVIYYAWKLYFSSYAALSTTGTIEDPQETTEIAVMIARIVNGFRALNRTHPGALFVLHNYLCTAALFLPPKLHVWVRRTLAHIQAMGYNFPEQVRWQMASVWKDDDLYKGWLEGLEPTDDPADGVVIPWKRLLQVKIPEMNQERMGFTTSMSEMRGIFGTGVDLGSAHIGA